MDQRIFDDMNNSDNIVEKKGASTKMKCYVVAYFNVLQLWGDKRYEFLTNSY